MQYTEDHQCPDRSELLKRTKINIEKFGLQVMSIDHTDYSPPFSYSIGLYQSYGHPEIICFGLSAKLCHTILNHIAEVIQSGEVIQLEHEYSDIFFKASRCQFLKVKAENINDFILGLLKVIMKMMNSLHFNWCGQTEMTSSLGKRVFKKNFYMISLYSIAI